MNNKKSFGECLSELLVIFNLNGSKLAKGINVDPSLIYKWLRDDRIPSYQSPYIELITNYLVSNIRSSSQKKAVQQALKKWSLRSFDLENTSILEIIKTTLLESQGYSIEFLYNKIGKKKQINHFLKAVNSCCNVEKTSAIQKNTPTYHIEKSDTKEDLFLSTDLISIIKGNKEVLYTALHMLEDLPKNTQSDDNTILITFNSHMELLTNYKEFNIRWKHALYNTLNNGWKIIYLVKLNSNLKRTMKLIEDMQLALATGKYQLYYYIGTPDMLTANELIIFPKIAALYCFSSQLKGQVDSAFLFKSPVSIELLSKHFFQIYSSAKPLLKSYPSQDSIEFQHMLTEAEECLGDRYVFKGDISTITFPMRLYEKFLNSSKKSKKEISKRLSLHQRRLDAFESQIKFYQYKDIWFKESIEKLVNEKKYYFNQYYIFENIILDHQDIIFHLENVIYMLTKYEHYQVAIVSKGDYENTSKVCWMVKENNSVFIEALDSSRKNTSSSYNRNNEINLLISEKEVVNAFRDYFLLIWNRMNPAYKDKAVVINWLQNQIDLLKNQN